ncbi:MAG: ureidoglycolate lyase [Candidatus Goldiibacteriota bacterium]
MIKIKQLTHENFRPYGGILEPEDKSDVFTVLCGDENAKGWRIGYVILGPDKVKSLEAHPGSFETFEPVSGVSVILAAPEKEPEKIEAFLLDKSVLINKNIWHAVRVLSGKAEIKVVENFKVDSVYHDLKNPVDVGFSEEQ